MTTTHISHPAVWSLHACRSLVLVCVAWKEAECCFYQTTRAACSVTHGEQSVWETTTTGEWLNEGRDHTAVPPSHTLRSKADGGACSLESPNTLTCSASERSRDVSWCSTSVSQSVLHHTKAKSHMPQVLVTVQLYVFILLNNLKVKQLI